MKARKQLLLMVIALISMAMPASAIGLEDIRINARFLTDRMAFELNLNTNQYNDLYEVNYDFFNSVDPYLAAVAREEAYALDRYYRYLDERNDDLRWILSNAEYTRFMALDYFFRPFYALDNLCYLRIYQRYPDRSYFYYHRPVHYLTYCGGHGRGHWHGASYYKRHYKKRYRHPVYRGDYQCCHEYRKHDFGPRPGGPHRPSVGSGYHFTPVVNSRPEMGRPGNGRHDRPNFDRPGNNRHDRPKYDRPGSSMRPEMGRPGNSRNDRPNWGRPNKENSRPEMSRPGNNRNDRPNFGRHDNKRNDRPGSSMRPGNNRNDRPKMSRPGNSRNDRPNFSRPDNKRNDRPGSSIRPDRGNSRSSGGEQRGRSSVRRGNPDGQRNGGAPSFQRSL